MKKPTKLPRELRALRDLPMNARADAIIGIFQFAVSEFAALVLEHVKPRRAPKRRGTRKSRS